MAFAWCPSLVPRDVPNIEHYDWIERVFLFDKEGKKDEKDGLATGPHAIFAGVKRDMDGLSKFVAQYGGQPFKSPHHESLFKWQTDEIKKRLVVIYTAFMGRLPNWG